MRKSWYLATAAMGVSALMATACGSSPNSSPSSSQNSTQNTGSNASSVTTAVSDSQYGTGASALEAAIRSAQKSPLHAKGAPITLTLQNLVGDPAGSFPELDAGAKAAVAYINDDLGGIGANLSHHTPGRPLVLDVCDEMATPTASVSCANQLVGDHPDLAMFGVEYFSGSAQPVYAKAGIPVLNMTPINPTDNDSPYEYAMSGGAPISFEEADAYLLDTVHAHKIAVIYDNNAPAIYLYNAYQAGSLAVAKKSDPSLQYKGFEVTSTEPDFSSTIAQVIAYHPDAVTFSPPGPDCAKILKDFASLGNNASSGIKIYAGSSCEDSSVIAAAGSAAVTGVNFFGGGYTFQQPSAYSSKPFVEEVLQTYQNEMKQNASGTSPDLPFAFSGFSNVMFAWQSFNHITSSGQSVTPATVNSYLKSTNHVYLFGGPPVGCAAALSGYKSLCGSAFGVNSYNGSSLTAIQSFTSDVKYLPPPASGG